MTASLSDYTSFARQLVDDQAALVELEASLRKHKAAESDSSLLAFGLVRPVEKGVTVESIKAFKLAEKKRLVDERVRESKKNGFRKEGKSWTSRSLSR